MQQVYGPRRKATVLEAILPEQLLETEGLSVGVKQDIYFIFSYFHIRASDATRSKSVLTENSKRKCQTGATTKIQRMTFH